MQQFIENQKLLAGETLPIDPMKYVDSSLVDTALAGLEKNSGRLR